MEPYKLRKDLLLGVATAATQIEGDEENTNWYRFSLDKNNTKDGSTPYLANKHYTKYKEDTLLMKQMCIEIYRMGIEWSRIQPKENEFNEEAIKHYIDEISLLQENGIKVLVTLHHFSNPLWFEDMGGFLNKNAVAIFKKYVEYVVTKFKGLVKEYVTINEANIYASNSFLFGIWPPKKTKVRYASKVMKTLAICHIEAYKIIKAIDPDTKVGFANHMVEFSAKNPKNPFDRLGAKFYDNAFQGNLNRAMTYGKFGFPMGHSRKYKGDYIDFFGMNFYTRNIIHGFKMTTDTQGDHNDLGWQISPSSLEKFCKRFYDEFQKEIYITENGTADRNDNFRAKYIYDHLKVIAPLPYVTRYYHWTFMDNWEWAEGQEAKFGLVECVFETQERIIRPSGHFYTEIINNKEVTQEMITKYIEK